MVVVACLGSGCLSSPDSLPAPDGGPDGAPRSLFRSIGPKDAPIASVEVTPIDDTRITTIPDISDLPVIGAYVDVDGTVATIAGIDGSELLLEGPLAAAGAATVWHAYGTLSQWETSRARDLVAEGVTEVALVTEDQDLSDNVRIEGFTTDADHRVIVRAADGREHTGRSGTGVTISAIGANFSCLVVRDDNVEISRLAFRACGTEDGQSAIRGEGARGLLIDRVLVHDYDVATFVGGVLLREASTATVRNSIFYQGKMGVDVDPDDEIVIENCTFWSSDDAINADLGSVVVVRNSILFGSLDSDVVDYDASLAFTAQTGIIASTPAELFVSFDVPLDLHLGPQASAAVGGGADLRNSFDHDVDGDVRGASWDIGADQRTSAE